MDQLGHNAIVSFDSVENVIKIGPTTIKIKPIKDNLFLGLHEAYSSSPNETQFTKASEIFKNIVQSNDEQTYNEIAQQILANIDSSNETKNLHNELSNLILTLCPRVHSHEINKSIDEYGGMINYILISMSKKNYLSPQEKTIEINDPFINSGLILYYNEITQSPLMKSTPFSVWKQNKNGSIQLTRIAKNRICSSNYPCIVMLFGSLRTGKSTLASHLMSGPVTIKGQTLFKSAGSSKACTRLINALGPIKCKEFASHFQIEQKENVNLDRDIFLVDSEGLNALKEETAWLRQALLSMLPVNTISFFVAITKNKNDLDYFMKYLRLETFIGSKKIEHGIGYINNQQKFDGEGIIEQLFEENKNSTNEMIEEFTKRSITVDDSHFKSLSVLSFDRHQNEYFASVGEVAKFIVERCLNEGALIKGDMIADSYEEFANKINEITDLTDTNKMFETIFYEVLKNAMKRSIERQFPDVQKQISQKLLMMPFQEINLLDINAFLAQIKESGMINDIINNAIAETLPEIPESFPLIIDASRTNLIEIIDDFVNKERIKLLDMQANEVHDLGHGFSIYDGIFKRKVIDANYSTQLSKLNLDANSFIAFHLPEFVVLNRVPIEYQNQSINKSLTLENYLCNFNSKFNENASLDTNYPKINFSKACNFSSNSVGISYSSNSPETNISVSTNVNSLAQVHFDHNSDLKQLIVPPLKNKFDELDRMLTTSDIKSPEIKSFVSEIFEEYGESVAIGFFIGNYEIEIVHGNNINIQSGGQIAFSSGSNESNGLNVAGLKLGNSKSNQNSKGQMSHSQNISSTQTSTKISYGSPTQPASFMFDIIDNSRFGSSFLPLFKIAPSQQVSNSLKHWMGRWNLKPTTLSEYKYANCLDEDPKGINITLFNGNRPYTVFINQKCQYVIPNSYMKYTYTYKYLRDKGSNDYSQSETIYEIILDPVNMTISRFPQNPYADRWKDNIGHHNRAYGYENLHLEVNLGPFWEFAQPVISANFTGNGLYFMNLNYINSHSIMITFNELPGQSGDRWPHNLVSVNLQQNLHVRLV